MEKSNISFLNGNYKISLYIHIPFCRSKCYYCDFFSVKHSDAASEAAINAIIKQYRYYISRLPDVEISTIYIGGGTPSVLKPKTLEYLFSNLKKFYLESHSSWDIKEWTVEANPESLNEEFIKVCKDYGITRLSVGIESLHDEYLNILGRPGNSLDVYKAIALLKKLWKRDVSYDILSGIPYITNKADQNIKREKDLLYDLRRIIDTSPEHISLYSLTVEKETKLYKLIKQHKYIAMDSESEAKEWLKCVKLLEKKNYNQYEVSNFSKQGKECIHNIRYWQMEPYLGIGPSAVSTMPLSADIGNSRIVRITGQRDISNFIRDTSLKNSSFFNSNIEIISPSDFLFENFMMGFRMQRGISKYIFKNRFGKSLEDLLPGLIDKWEKERLIKINYESYALTRKGLLFLNTLLLSIQKYMELPSLKQIQVQWPLDMGPEI